MIVLHTPDFPGLVHGELLVYSHKLIMKVSKGCERGVSMADEAKAHILTHFRNRWAYRRIVLDGL